MAEIMMQENRILILLPAKNEEDVIEYPIKSILNQHRNGLILKLILIDDASSDSTFDVMKEYAKKYEWIHSIRVTKSVDYPPGIKMVRALKYGLTYANHRKIQYDYIMKIDADTFLYPDYIIKIKNEMDKNHRIGIAGGITVNEEFDKLHVRDTGMMIRRKTFEEVGGYKPVPNPDTYLQMKAIERGWTIKVVNEAKMLLLRKTGAATKNSVYYLQQGFTSRLVGYNYFLLTLRLLNIFVTKRELQAMYFIIGALYAEKEKKNMIQKNIFINNYFMKKQKMFFKKILRGIK